jgi:hypothetical protein
MGGDLRGDDDPTCKIAGIAYTGSNPVPATRSLSWHRDSGRAPQPLRAPGALPAGIKCTPVRDALAADLNRVPFWLRRSLTWDRGREMADHAAR